MLVALGGPGRGRAAHIDTPLGRVRRHWPLRGVALLYLAGHVDFTLRIVGRVHEHRADRRARLPGPDPAREQGRRPGAALALAAGMALNTSSPTRRSTTRSRATDPEPARDGDLSSTSATRRDPRASLVELIAERGAAASTVPANHERERDLARGDEGVWISGLAGRQLPSAG